MGVAQLVIPSPLAEEFATVALIVDSQAETRGTDALILSWAKYEKQLRRLFCFLAFQHPVLRNSTALDEVVQRLAAHGSLYARTFIAGIDALGVDTVAEVVGARHDALTKEIGRVHEFRNKIVHGQVTGRDLDRPALIADVVYLIEWVSLVAEGGQRKFGYDGLGRDTYSRALSAPTLPNRQWPFATIEEFATWLDKIAKAAR